MAQSLRQVLCFQVGHDRHDSSFDSGKRTHRERTVSRKTNAASRTQARTRSLLGMWGFPAKVVTEADGRGVGYILSLRIHGVAEPRFDESVARLREVPFGSKDRVPCLEVRINERVQVARYIVLKAANDCELPELQSGIDFDSTSRESHCQRLQGLLPGQERTRCHHCFAAPRRRPIPGCAKRLSRRGPSSPCHHR